MQQEPPAYFLTSNEYTGNAPAFYDTSQFAWVKLIEDNWQVIRDEMLHGLNPDDIAVPGYNPNLVAKASSWRNICFYNYLWKKKDAFIRYPKTAALLKQIPNLTYASLNMLAPNSEIFPHRGDTNITARCHLGIIIPAQLPDCGMKVNGVSTSWHEGKIFAFSDAHIHEVWNRTPSHRFVFVVDVVLQQYASHKAWYCSKVLSALSLKAMSYKFPILQRAPVLLIKTVHNLLASAWFVYLQLQNIF